MDPVQVIFNEMTYVRLNADEPRGDSQTEYLVSLDAHFRVVDGAATVFDEPGYPLVELARSMSMWLADPDRQDFVFDSMSYEEVRSLALRQSAGGWIVESVFAPGTSTSVLDWAEVERSCLDFVSRVTTDLLGIRPDAAAVIQQ